MKVALTLMLVSSLTLSAWLFQRSRESDAREQTYKQLLLKSLKGEAYLWQEMFESSAESEHALMRDLILINLEGVVGKAELLAKLDGMAGIAESESIRKIREIIDKNPIKPRTPAIAEPHAPPRKVLIPSLER